VHRLQPQEPLAAARDLFVALRELDAGLQGLGGGEIWIQAPPPQAEWDGVRDRLTRAAAAA